MIGTAVLDAAEEPDDGLAKKMLPIYLKDVQGYSFAVESAPEKPLELRKEPVLEWSNRHRGSGVTQGTLFLWLRDGRPAAIGCMFSYPNNRLGGRTVAHEMHALDPEKLVVTHESANKWVPEAGLDRNVLADSGAPAESAAARLIQIKRLAAEFIGHEIDRGKRRLELRVLPTPLYRYPPAKSGVIDGALFTLAADSSTDPEVMLLIEARQVEGKARWEYACCRFSDLELHVQRKNQEVFSYMSGERTPHGLYDCHAESVVSEDGKVLARVRNGVTTPVEEK